MMLALGHRDGRGQNRRRIARHRQVKRPCWWRQIEIAEHPSTSLLSITAAGVFHIGTLVNLGPKQLLNLRLILVLLRDQRRGDRLFFGGLFPRSAAAAAFTDR